jgi:hypothetical protein
MVILIASYSVNALNFVAYGDSRSNPGSHKTVLDAYMTKKPELVIHTGDLWDGYDANTWKSHFTSNPAASALLSANKVLVSRGNHETRVQLLQFTPTLVRNGREPYSFTEGNCFFVCMGFAPGDSIFLEAELKSAAARAAAWRFVYAHKPIYSSGSHGGNGFVSEGTSVSKTRELFDTYGVTAYFSGHDHIYERTFPIYKGAVASREVTVDLSATPSTLYFVTGGGGAPLYGTATNWWTSSTQSTLHYAMVTTTDTTCTFQIYTSSNSRIDMFTFKKKTTADKTPPVISNTRPSGTVASKSVTLAVSTDEKAYVRYSLADQSYDSMKTQFTTGEGALEHAATMSVMHGKSYTLYVRATDLSGNATTASKTITFTVDTSKATGVIAGGAQSLVTSFTLVSSGRDQIQTLFTKSDDLKKITFRLHTLTGTVVREFSPAAGNAGQYAATIPMTGLTSCKYVLSCYSGEDLKARFSIAHCK